MPNVCARAVCIIDCVCVCAAELPNRPTAQTNSFGPGWDRRSPPSIRRRRFLLRGKKSPSIFIEKKEEEEKSQRRRRSSSSRRRKEMRIWPRRCADGIIITGPKHLFFPQSSSPFLFYFFLPIDLFPLLFLRPLVLSHIKVRQFHYIHRPRGSLLLSQGSLIYILMTWY